jgi:methylated-DNA-[protein]-cysteine S-methyltransferase
MIASTLEAVAEYELAGMPLKLALYSAGRALCALEVDTEQAMLTPRSALAEKTLRQLDAYFDDPLRPFDLPLQAQGTVFQLRLWSALAEIEVGETLTYGQMAKQLNSAAQAVGQACRRNPLAIIVPCHRVLSQVGLGGYGGESAGRKLAIKQALLTHEGLTFSLND